jgi:hypothetical protein
MGGSNRLRWQDAVQVAAVYDHPGLVDGGPHLDAVVEGLEQQPGVVGEPLGAVAVEPAAAVVQGSRQVPVVERDQRPDAVREQAVDQTAVEVEAAGVHLAAALRQHAAPRDAEAVGVEPQVAHQLDVAGIPPVVVAGDVAGLAARDHAGSVGEAMPVAGAGAVGERRALDLVGGGRSAPEEAVGKDRDVRLGHLRRLMPGLRSAMPATLREDPAMASRT